MQLLKEGFLLKGLLVIFIERFTCGQNGCERTFNTRVSIFKKHLKSHQHDVEQVPLDFHQDVESNCGEGDDDDDREVIPEAENNIELQMWDNFGEDELKERASMLIASLLGSSSVAHSTVVDVVERTADLMEDVSSFFKFKLNSFATAVGIPEDNADLRRTITDIDSVSHPFQNLQTQYQQKKFLESSEYFIKADELPLGIGYYPRNNPATNNIQQVMKTISFQYVSIK